MNPNTLGVNESAITIIKVYQQSANQMLVRPGRGPVDTSDEHWWDRQCEHVQYTEHYGGLVYQSTLMIIHAILNYVRSLKSRVLRKKQAYQHRNRNKLVSSIN